MDREAVAGLMGLSQMSEEGGPPAGAAPPAGKAGAAAAAAAAAGAAAAGTFRPAALGAPGGVALSQHDVLLPSQVMLNSQELARTPVPLEGGPAGAGGGSPLAPGAGGALPAGVGGAALDLTAPAAAQPPAHRLSVGSRPPSGMDGGGAVRRDPRAALKPAAVAAAPPVVPADLPRPPAPAPAAAPAAPAAAAPPPAPAAPPGPKLVRRGPMDEMRQLVRILVKLIPHAAAYVMTADEGGGNRLAEAEVKHFLTCTLGEAPPPEWGLPAGWGVYLAALFTWARSAQGGGEGGAPISTADAMRCARRLPGRSWEAVDGELRRLGLAPATWPLPLTRAGLAAAAGRGGDALAVAAPASAAPASAAPGPAGPASPAAADAAAAMAAAVRGAAGVPTVLPSLPGAQAVDMTALTEVELWHLAARALSLAGARAGTAAAAASPPAGEHADPAARAAAAAAAASTVSHIAKLKTQIAYHVGVLVARGDMPAPAAAVAAGAAAATGLPGCGGGGAGGGRGGRKSRSRSASRSPAPEAVAKPAEEEAKPAAAEAAKAEAEGDKPPPAAETEAAPAASAEPTPAGVAGRKKGRPAKRAGGAGALTPLSLEPTAAKRARPGGGAVGV